MIGAKKAIGAVAASILTAAYHMLKTGALYEDLGADHFDKRGKGKQIDRLVRRLQNLGFAIEITPERQPPDAVRTPAPVRARRSSHGPPDGGLAGAVPPASCVLGGRDDAERLRHDPAMR